MLSNYPDGRAVHASLDRVRLTPFFDAVVVSGDIGFVKPHPLPFATVLHLTQYASIGHIADLERYL